MSHVPYLFVNNCNIWIDRRIKHYWDTMMDTHTEDGLIWMDTTQMVKDVTEQYDEVQRFEYLMNQDEVCRDLARRRYATIATQMMMVETYLNDGVYSEEIRDRVLAVINYCTNQMIASYGDEINKSLNESVDKQFQAISKKTRKIALDTLEEMFTTKDFEAKVVEYNGSKASVSKMLLRLERGGVIERVSCGIYKKK